MRNDRFKNFNRQRDIALIESIFDIDAQGEKEATYRRVAVSEFTHE
jgi:hypothetical protein